MRPLEPESFSNTSSSIENDTDFASSSSKLIRARRRGLSVRGRGVAVTSSDLIPSSGSNPCTTAPGPATFRSMSCEMSCSFVNNDKISSSYSGYLYNSQDIPHCPLITSGT
uniref:(northern house mosquito) hypothetical protein n=1 Tax=Culex pipiens TaxID=7175 RepID=A0A8D8DA84_CULPI